MPRTRVIVLHMFDPVQEFEHGYRFNGEVLPKEAFLRINKKKTVFYFKSGWIFKMSEAGIHISRRHHETTVLAEKIKSVKYADAEKHAKDR